MIDSELKQKFPTPSLDFLVMNTLARFVSAAAALWPAVLAANTAPTVVIQSASMRPGTTLMDIVYRVNDPDDATVKTRALAFIGGVRSFANLIKPVTFAEGTSAHLGDAIATNTNHTLAWDAAADWDTDLGQVKFEILAMDGRGLLPIDWITIPAANGNPALTISKDTPADAAVLNALFWQYADGDSGLILANGVLTGNASSGNFSGFSLVSGATIQPHAPPYILKRMNLDPATEAEVKYANESARAGLMATSSWHAANRIYSGISALVGRGDNAYGQTTIPTWLSSLGLTNVSAIAAGYYHSLALTNDGTVFGWGSNSAGQTTIPSGLTNVSAIAAGHSHSLALKNDGTVVGWGSNSVGQTTVPAGLTNVKSISAAHNHSLALKNDGTVVAWGWEQYGAATPPNGLSNVSAIATGHHHSLALKNDGTVVAWGLPDLYATTIPAGLTDVSAIAAGFYHSIALKNDGSIVEWGGGEPNIVRTGLTNVSAIAASGYSLALKNDGSVVGIDGATLAGGLTNVSAIAAGPFHYLAIRSKAP